MKATLALIQMNFGPDRAEVLDRADAAIAEAAGNGAQLICFPELANSIYFPFKIDPDWQDLAEPIPGPTTDRIAKAAAAAGAYVIFPLYEHVQHGELYNSAAVLGPDGELVGRYRKNSIPLAHTTAMPGFEKFYFRPGNLGFPVFDTNLGIRIGIVICYERHFPEGPRALALQGADVLFVPTSTGAKQELWELELRSHAAANMLWVAGVNRVGTDVDGGPASFYGTSMVCDPNGIVVASAGDAVDEIVYAEIDSAETKRLRQTFGWFRDRRPDLYGILTQP